MSVRLVVAVSASHFGIELSEEVARARRYAGGKLHLEMANRSIVEGRVTAG